MSVQIYSPLSPVSTLMPGTMPWSRSTSTKGLPSAVD